MTDSFDELADIAERGVRLANDPNLLRARLAELEGAKAANARREITEAIQENEAAFNDAVDRRDPAVIARIENMGKGGS